MASSAPSAPASVAILGAGITGLTAAWHLRRAGIDVTVYEAGPRVGGAICSHREGPWLAEGGPNTILETSPAIAEFVDALGLASRRHYSDPSASARFIVRGGRPVELPSSPLGFFLGRQFSFGAKLRLLREPFIARGSGEESVAAFVRRRLGEEFLAYAIDPLVTGIYAGDPAALSVRHAFAKIQGLEERYGSLIRGQLLGARERRRRAEVSKDKARKFSFDDGLQVLPDTLHTTLGDAVRLNSEILALERTADGWKVEVRAGAATTASFTAGHAAVLCCGNAAGLARLPLRGAGPDSLASLAEIRHPPVTSVVLGYRREEVLHPCSGFGVLIPHCERFGILGTIFSSALFPGRAPKCHVTLTTYVGGMRNPEAAAVPDGPLVDRVHEDLRRLFGIDGQPAFVHIRRWPRAIPQYEVGYGRFKELFDRLEAGAPGLYFAGHLRDGVALSDSIHAGARAAGRIREHLAARGLEVPGPIPNPPQSRPAPA